jgi:hypothetical protein
VTKALPDASLDLPGLPNTVANVFATLVADGTIGLSELQPAYSEEELCDLGLAAKMVAQMLAVLRDKKVPHGCAASPAATVDRTDFYPVDTRCCAQTLASLKLLLNGNPLDAGFWSLALMGTFDPDPPRATLEELLRSEGACVTDWLLKTNLDPASCCPTACLPVSYGRAPEECMHRDSATMD